MRGRLPRSAHHERPWRIHEVAGDLELEDVWALPTPGGPDDFPRLVELFAATDPSRFGAPPVRFLFALRSLLGRVLGWDDEAGDAANRPTLRDRLPPDLRDGPTGPEPDALPFTPLFLTDDEWAVETANATVHGVLHLGWVPDGRGGHRGQMAVLVRRNGLLGTAYMAAITPFRYAIVYPLMLRALGQAWSARAVPAAR